MGHLQIRLSFKQDAIHHSAQKCSWQNPDCQLHCPMIDLSRLAHIMPLFSALTRCDVTPLKTCCMGKLLLQAGRKGTADGNAMGKQVEALFEDCLN